mgnify:CR=1 FL=1
MLPDELRLPQRTVCALGPILPRHMSPINPKQPLQPPFDKPQPKVENSHAKHRLTSASYVTKSGSSLDEAFGLSTQLADVLGQLTDSTGSSGVGGTSTTESVNVAGQGNRSYILQLPEGFDPANSYNLAFGFGGMAMNLACQAPGLVDAVAGVATANHAPIYTGCSGSVPTLFLHGTEDATAPYYVSGSNPHGGVYLSVLRAFHTVGERNGCDISRKSIESHGRFNAEQMQGCSADTVLYTVLGGEHTWFPSNPTATREVWDFLNSR